LVDIAAGHCLLPKEIVVTILCHEKMKGLKYRSEMTSHTIKHNLKYKVSLEIHMLGVSLLKAMEIG
jgi:hypothetical protein